MNAGREAQWAAPRGGSTEPARDPCIVGCDWLSGAVYLWSAYDPQLPSTNDHARSGPHGSPARVKLVHAADGFQVFPAPGLIEPDRLEPELDRRGRLRGYWNGQARSAGSELVRAPEPGQVPELTVAAEG
jgi:hypothetical protein